MTTEPIGDLQNRIRDIIDRTMSSNCFCKYDGAEFAITILQKLIDEYMMIMKEIEE